MYGKRSSKRLVKRRKLQAQQLEDRRLLAADLESEPNDTRDLANELSLQVSTAVPSLIRGSVEAELQAGESDFFRFAAFAGDRVSVSVSDLGSGVDPEIYVRNSAGTVIAQDRDSGPGHSSLTSTLSIDSSGTYFIEIVGDNASTSGDYQIDAIIARNLAFESDPNQRNDSIYYADPIELAIAGNTLSGMIAGTISATDGTNRDEDLFGIGFMNAGQAVSIDSVVPEWSDLSPNVELLDATGTPVIDTNASHASFDGTTLVDSEYFIRVSAESGEGPNSQYAVTATINDTVPPRVASFDRLPGGQPNSDTLFSTFSIDFTEALLVGSLSETVFDLRSWGADGQFNTTDDVRYDLDFNYDDAAKRIDFEITDGPLDNGTYSFAISSTVTDQVGNAMESGAGYNRTFIVDAVPVAGVFEGRDNGEYGKATPLSLEADTNGTGWLRSEIGFGAIDPSSDEDWWSFDASAGDSVDVWVQPRSDGFRPSVFLYQMHEDGTRVVSIGSDYYGSGPNLTGYLSGIEVPTDGTYFVMVQRYAGAGQYDVRVNVNRSHAIETDVGDANRSIGGADPLVFSEDSSVRSVDIAGTITEQGDVDYYQLGHLNAGTTLTVDASLLPDWSILEATVEVVSADGTVVLDDDASDAIFRGALASDGTYYARVWANTAVIDGSRFTLTDQASGWNDAEAAAVASGGHLASIENAAQTRLLYDTFGGNKWIGLNDVASEGTFQWSDGSDVDFTIWGPGYPNSYDHAAFSSNVSWYTTYESRSLQGIIEVPAEPGAPTVSGGGMLSQYLLSVEIGDLVPPTVASVSRLPEEEGVLDQLVSTFTVSFSESIDTETLSAAPLELRGAGEDGVLDTGDDVLYNLSHGYDSDAFEVSFTVHDGPILEGLHRFTIGDDVTDALGNALDGDGDSTTGGDFVLSFTVDAVPEGGVFEGRDNGEYGKATPLSLEADTNGTGWLRSEIGFGAIDPSSDEDWWSFDASAGDSVDVWVQPQSDGFRPSVFLYQMHEDGTRVVSIGSDYYGSGPNLTGYLSGIEVPTDGTYFVMVQRYAGAGQYDVRVNVNRSHAIETDVGDANRSIGGADPLVFSEDSSVRSVDIAGTITEQGDVDYYQLGHLNAGTTLTVDASLLPDWSILEATVEVVSADGTVVPDDDASDAIFHGALVNDGTYYARVWANTAVIDGSRFTLTDQASGWNDAEAAAVASGGHLASIDNAAQTRLLYDTFGGNKWIGLNDVASEGTFQWSDGSDVDFTIWGPGYPNSYDHAAFSSNVSWYTTYESRSLQGIIEVPAEPGAPTVSGGGMLSQYLLSVEIGDLVPPTVASVSRLPEEEGVLDQLVSTFTVSFSESIDTETLSAAPLELRGAGEDGVLDTGDDVLYNLSHGYDSDAFEVSFTVHDGPILEGLHRFTIGDDVTDALGNALDGDGDSTTGGDFVLSFTVDAVPEGGVFEGRDNGEYGKATPLSLEADTNGTGWLRSEIGFGVIDPRGDQDWWSFDALAGDSVDVWVQPQGSVFLPYLTLYQMREDGSGLVALDSDYAPSGPGNTAYIADVLLPADGTYYVRMQTNIYHVGSQYEVRINVNRGHQIERDENNGNRSIGGANALTFDETGTVRSASIVGTITEQGDVDYYQLGHLNAGTTLTVDASSLPEWSILEPSVEIVSADGTVIPDDDTSDAIFHGTLASDGTYYARVWANTAVIDGSRFTLTDQASGWNDAEAAAVAAGGHLASIDNAEQTRLLYHTFGGNRWIGLNDVASEGTFQWSDGSDVDFTIWGPGYPNSYNHAAFSSNVSWYTTYESRSLYGIVEVPAEPGAPTVSGGGMLSQYLLSVEIGDLVPPTVAGVSRLPEEEAVLDQLVSTFTVSFSESIDTETLSAATLELRGAGEDGVLDTGDDVLYNLSHGYDSDAFEVSFAVLDGPLVDGQHRLTIDDAVTDVLGNALDGDLDNTAGGDFVRTFTVDAIPEEGVFEGRDNGEYGKATPLGFEADTNGTGWLRSEIGFGAIDPTSDQDWWSFDALTGDSVDVWVQPQSDGFRPSVFLYKMHEDGMRVVSIGSDYNGSGPDLTGYLSGMEVPTDGTYFVMVQRYAGAGQYDVRVNLHRSSSIETDQNYSNDTRSNADLLALSGDDSSRYGSMVGTVMAGQSGNVDEDYFQLGVIEAGETILARAQTPAWSTLEPLIEIRDADGNVVSVNPVPTGADVARFTATDSGVFYAVVVGIGGEGIKGQYRLDVTVSDELSVPDLVVSAIDLPSPVSAGEQVTVSWTVGNFGTAATDATSWVDRVILSANDTINDFDDIVLGNFVRDVPLSANQTYDAELTVSLSQRLAGPYHLFVQTDFRNDLFEFVLDDNNLTQSATPWQIGPAPLPDLVVPVESMVAPTQIDPEAEFSVAWRTENVGAVPAPGGWVERVYIADSSSGQNRQLLGLFTHDEDLAAGSSTATRTETFQLPAGSFAGDVYFVVEVDATDSIYESDETNHFVATTASDVRTLLSFISTSTEIEEGGAQARITLVRNGSTAHPLSVSLQADVANQIDYPREVIIPAGRSRVTFYVSASEDAIVDGDRAVQISATATDFDVAEASFDVIDRDRATITATLSETNVLEGDSTTLTVSHNGLGTSDVVVRITATPSNQIDFPAAVLIPAGQTSVDVTATVTDDSIFESAGTIVIDGKSAGYVAGRADLNVPASDVPTLQIDIPSTMAEGDDAIGTITLDAVRDQPVHVLLNSDAAGLFVLPTLTIPAGARSAQFSMLAIENSDVDAARSIAVMAAPVTDFNSAAIADAAVIANVSLLDNDGPTLSAWIDRGVISENGIATLTVSRNTDTSGALVVSLLADDSGELAVPATVTIAAGERSATVAVQGLEDSVADGDQNVQVTAAADGFNSGLVNVIVSDLDLPDLVVASLEIPAEIDPGSRPTLHWSVANLGIAAATDGWTERIYLSSDPQFGNDTLLAEHRFSGPLSVDASNGRSVPVTFPDTPGEFWVIVEVDGEQTLREGIDANNRFVSPTPILLRPSYTATVSAEIESAAAGTAVTLAGSAANTDGTPAALVDVVVHITVRGTTRTLDARTDANGNFQTLFTPLSGEAGRYAVAASHPALSAPMSQDTFDLHGLVPTAGFDFIGLPAGSSTTQSITIRNLADLPLTGLSITTVDVASGLSVTPSVPASNVAASGSFDLTYDLTDLSADQGASQFVLRVSTNEAPALEIPITVDVIAPQASLAFEQSTLETSMVVGEQTSVELVIENRGVADSGPIELFLPAEAPWMSVISGRTIENLPAGDKLTVTLMLQPSIDLELGSYRGSIVASSEAGDIAVDFDFRATAETVGELRVTVVDELFYFAEGAPTVRDAAIELRDAITRALVATNAAVAARAAGESAGTVTVDDDGAIRFSDVPRGKYIVQVSADSHDPNEVLLEIPAGDVADEQIFISRNFVEYTWTVEEVEVEDRTRVTIEAVFETNVPAPVVVVESNIDLSALSNPGDTQTFEVKYTNEGFIQAEAVEIFFDEHPYYEIAPLVNEIPILPARSTATIPVRVTRRVVAGPPPEGESAGSLPDADCHIDGYTIYRYECGPNGVWKRVPIAVIGVDGNCAPGGGAHSPGGGGTFVGTGLGSGPSAGGPSFGGKTGDGVPPGLPPDPVFSGPPPAIPQAPSSCDACLEEVGEQARDYLIGKIPFAGEITMAMGFGDSVQDVADAVAGNDSFDKNDAKSLTKTALGFVALFPSPWGMAARGVLTAWDAYDSLYPLLTKCAGLFGFGPSAPVTPLEGEAAAVGPAVQVAASRLQELLDFYQAFSAPEQYLYGSAEFIGVSQSLERLSWVADVKSLTLNATENFQRISSDDRQLLIDHAHRPDAVSDEEVDRFVDRINRSIDYWDAGVFTTEDLPEGANGDFIDLKHWGGLMQEAETAYSEFGEQSMAALDSAIDDTVLELLNAMNGHSDDGVCAAVRLQITQDVVQTRQGFQATLGIANQTTSPLNAVIAEVVVLDRTGNDVSELFGVQVIASEGFDINGGSATIGIGGDGTTTWLIVPSTEAAPLGATEYFVAGSFQYDQFGLTVKETLLPTAITVLPQPELVLDYFLQRDVVSDDPFTDAVEPAEIFTLGAQVRNHGVGIARDLRIESAQPKIIENEKGLLIDFEIVGTSVNGEPAQRTLTAEIGDLAGGELAIAQWQLEASLQGLFTEYEASFEHISDFGRPDLSLVKSVEIHELIRPVQATASGVDDRLSDFLVNDIPDVQDLPDTLYLSDGSVQEVQLGSDAQFDPNASPWSLVVDVSATMPDGWGYLRLQDPSDGNHELIGIRRSDGSLLASENFWQTDRTFIGLGKRPVYENVVHLLDFDSTGEYQFVYSNGDRQGPVVERFSGVSPNPTDRAIDVIDVHFDEPIDPATLLRDAITLLKNGVPLDTPTLAISANLNPTLRLSGLGALTADDAVYELHIELASVRDLSQNPAQGVASLTWVKGEAAPAVIEVSGLPSAIATTAVDSFQIQVTESVQLASLQTALSIQRDGNPIDLSSASFHLVSEGLYEVSGLNALTATDGDYQVSIDAARLIDLDGLFGFGSTSKIWTLDTTAPQITDLFAPPTNPRNIVVQRIDVQFSEPVDLTSLGVDDLRLVRDGAAENLIAGDSRVTIEDRGDNVYRIAGINWVQGFIADPQIADFTFTIHGSEIQDLAGNSGSGSLSTTWTIDLVSPTVPTDMALAVEPATDGTSTSAANAVFSGTVDENGLTLVIENEYTGDELFRGTLNDRQFSIPLRLPSEGRNELSGRLIDNAGNTTDFPLPDAFTNLLPPTVVETSGFKPTIRATAIDAFSVTFAKPIRPETLTRDVLTLWRDDTAVPLPAGLTIDASADAFILTISGLRSATADEGAYRLSIDLSGVRSTDGLAGTGTYSERWMVDTTPPTTRVVSTPLESTARRYLLSVESDPSQGTSSPISEFQVYAASENSPLRLVAQLEPESPATEFSSELNEEHLFFSDSIDAAGNQQRLSIGSTGQFPIRLDGDALAGLPDDLTFETGTEFEFSGEWTVQPPVLVDGGLVHQVQHGVRLLNVQTSTPWSNPVLVWDVNHDGLVTPLDALQIINRLNRISGMGDVKLPQPEGGTDHRYYDVTGDGNSTPLDALRVLNALNRRNFGEVGESESLAAAALNPWAPLVASQGLVEPAWTVDHQQSLIGDSFALPERDLANPLESQEVDAFFFDHSNLDDDDDEETQLLELLFEAGRLGLDKWNGALLGHVGPR
ncbi:Lectin C-type domain protein [Rosistilla ulvae]|uniref:Lectin C-type domain protein n=1 Tax=Rosistilla ulvae TaxID=1930277 RepID=A0A517M726_9BACT|nr:CARDB domain-containing protein [Rosistilla ulvae]QDS90691.1 Lectin C-type domain protein [Rosistilla ulvae]